MFLVKEFDITVTPGRTDSDGTTSASHLRGSCKLRYKQTQRLVLMLQYPVLDTEVWTITHLWGIFPNRSPPSPLNDIARLETAPLEPWLWKEGAGGGEGGQRDRGKYPWTSELSGSPRCSPHTLVLSPFVQGFPPAFPPCSSLFPYCIGTERKESAGRKKSRSLSCSTYKEDFIPDWFTGFKNVFSLHYYLLLPWFFKYFCVVRITFLQPHFM